MSKSDVSVRTRAATRAVFFCAGFALACWAPLVPYAKARTGIGEGALGLLLLCLGLGSMATMPLSGAFVARTGIRVPIMTGLAGLCLSLPVLATASGAAFLAPALFVFGASLGLTDVAMNVEAVEVERRSGEPLMSGFHAQFSIGGLAGAALLTAMLSVGLPPIAAVAGAVGLIALLALLAMPHLVPAGGADGPAFILPHGRVVLIGLLAMVSFLVEGAILDWSAVLLSSTRGVPVARAGIGYVLFSGAMVAGRLAGDRVVSRVGGRAVLLRGGLLVSCGIAWLLLMPETPLALGGFVMIGLGAANIAPTLFSAAGRQDAMPEALAIAAMSTLGYAGVLAGPAAIGLAAGLVGLPVAFAALAILILVIPLARRVGA